MLGSARVDSLGFDDEPIFYAEANLNWFTNQNQIELRVSVQFMFFSFFQIIF